MVKDGFRSKYLDVKVPADWPLRPNGLQKVYNRKRSVMLSFVMFWHRLLVGLGCMFKHTRRVELSCVKRGGESSWGRERERDKKMCAFSTSFAADDGEDEVAAWDAYGPCNSDCDMARFQVRVRRWGAQTRWFGSRWGVRGWVSDPTSGVAWENVIAWSWVALAFTAAFAVAAHDIEPDWFDGMLIKHDQTLCQKNPEASSSECQLCLYRCLSHISPRNLVPSNLLQYFFQSPACAALGIWCQWARNHWTDTFFQSLTSFHVDVATKPKVETTRIQRIPAYCGAANLPDTIAHHIA